MACSGGTDSLALAAATAFVAPRSGWRAGLVTVDHQLQSGSGRQAEAVASWGTAATFDPVEVATVRVAGRPGGPEAAAREARYEALARAAGRHGAAVVLLGHTRDDQAETVLLALLRGAGPGGLAAMPARREIGGVHLRPAPARRRPVADPGRLRRVGAHPMARPAQRRPGLHPCTRTYSDESFGRPARPGGGAQPGPRRRCSPRADDAALDDLAATAWLAAAAPAAPATDNGPAGDGLRVAELAGLATAVRTRVLHAWAHHLGVPRAALSYRHVTALDALVIGWHGQGPVHLPGAIIGLPPGRPTPSAAPR